MKSESDKFILLTQSNNKSYITEYGIRNNYINYNKFCR